EELDEHLTTTVSGQWVVWAHKLARQRGDLFVPLTGGPGYPADARAECLFQGVPSAHDAPDPGCTCGFHALSSRRFPGLPPAAASRTCTWACPDLRVAAGQSARSAEGVTSSAAAGLQGRFAVVGGQHLRSARPAGPR